MRLLRIRLCVCVAHVGCDVLGCVALCCVVLYCIIENKMSLYLYISFYSHAIKDGKQRHLGSGHLDAVSHAGRKSQGRKLQRRKSRLARLRKTHLRQFAVRRLCRARHSIHFKIDPRPVCNQTILQAVLVAFSQLGERANRKTPVHD